MCVDICRHAACRRCAQSATIRLYLISASKLPKSPVFYSFFPDCIFPGDQEGECRSHGNLGSAYFSKGNYQEALQHHRAQLVLATQLKDRLAAIAALSSLGHVYTALADYPNALGSHKQCVLLVKQGRDKLQEAREIGNVGSVYLAMGDFDSALQCHTEHLKMAKQLGDKVEEARSYSNMGSAYHYRRDYDKAITYPQPSAQHLDVPEGQDS